MSLKQFDPMNGIINISKKPGWLTLQPGDPWTFIGDKPLEGNPEIGAVISNSFAHDDPVRLFRIIKFHEPGIYETKYIGIAPLLKEKENGQQNA